MEENNIKTADNATGMTRVFDPKILINDYDSIPFKDLVIHDARYGETKQGLACGPVGGFIVTEVVLEDEEKKEDYYMTLVDVDGIPNFTITKESVFKENVEEIDDFLYPLYDQNRQPFDDGYTLKDQCHKKYYKAIKYVLYINELDKDEFKVFVKDTKGKKLKDITVPMPECMQD